MPYSLAGVSPESRAICRMRPISRLNSGSMFSKSSVRSWAYSCSSTCHTVPFFTVSSDRVIRRLDGLYFPRTFPGPLTTVVCSRVA